MRSFRVRSGVVVLIAAVGVALAGGGHAGAATPIEGTYRGAHLTRITGTLEGGFSVVAGESWVVFGCTVSAGTVLTRYAPAGGSKFTVTWLNVWATTTQGVEGVKCEYLFDGGPATVTVARSKSGLSIEGCGGACASSGSELVRVAAAPATTTAATTTTTTTPPVGKLVVTLFGLPNRYGPDANGDGLIDALTTAQQVNPAEWTASVYVHRANADCDPAAVYGWKVDGRAVELERTRTACVFSFRHFKALGRHRVAVTASGTGGQEAGSNIVVLRDLLIVGIGDSNASGEGNPDVAGASARWIDPRCNRSHFGYQAQTASALEHASDDTSVTFVHLACSGASLEEGLLGSYRGIADPGVQVSDIPPQIGALKALIKARPADGVKQRPIDALLVSIGVNDLHFGAIVKQCLERTDCFTSKGLPGTRRGETVAQAVKRWLAALPARYDRLAATFVALKVSPQKVFISQYFDSLRDQRGQICDPLIDVSLLRQTFTKDEAARAYSSFLLPLNAAVAAAARRHGWTLVPAPAAFRSHGYCAAASWIVPLTESLRNQWSTEGTLHANLFGHEAQRKGVVAALKRQGIDGKP